MHAAVLKPCTVNVGDDGRFSLNIGYVWTSATVTRENGGVVSEEERMK